MRKIIAVLLFICMLTALAACTGKKTDTSAEDKAKMEELFSKVCSADEALRLSKESDVVVMEDLKCTSGKAVWDDFYESVSAGKSASVLCANYYTIDKEHMTEELYEQEKDNYPCLYFTLLEYDGNVFTTKCRDSKSETMFFWMRKPRTGKRSKQVFSAHNVVPTESTIPFFQTANERKTAK